MARVDTDTMKSRDAIAALYGAECRAKSSALWAVGRALEEAGAMDGRAEQFHEHIDEARRLLNEVVRAHENMMALKRELA